VNIVILSDSGAFSQIIRYPLGKRAHKPRQTGVTMVIDTGTCYEQLSGLLEIGSAYMDVLKLGFGTSCLYPTNVLRQKLSLARVFSVHTCPGGTLGEIALKQNVYDRYLERCHKLGFTAVEISDGTIDMSLDTRRRCIAKAKSIMQVVISEVGKKLDAHTDIEAYRAQVIADTEAGADFIVIEGRESGEQVGIYGDAGKIDTSILEAFIASLPEEVMDKIIWEAPKKSQQVALINRFGQSVNLGNIAVNDVIALECLRLGLRADTFATTLTDDENL
jgi:phosphosulfolactate synthase